MRKVIKNFIYFIIIFSLFLLNFSCIWCILEFGSVSLDALFFQLNAPIAGTRFGVIISFILFPLLFSIIFSLIILFIVNFKYKVVPIVNIEFFKHKISFDFITFINKMRFVIIFCFLIFSFLIVNYFYSIGDFIALKNTNSTFISDNYVDARSVNIKFKKKKNVIFLGLESIENTFYDKANGGAYDENYIPNLLKLSKEGISFSDKNKRGIYSTSSTSWTTASMVAQSSGIGLSTSFGIADGSPVDLLGVYNLGDLLRDNGYNLLALGGTSYKFAYIDRFYKLHGDYDMKYYDYFMDKGIIPKNYYKWWGIEDSKLFELSKKEILDLAKEGKPFYVDLRTMNTHAKGGYVEDSCDIKYDEKLKNAVSCSDKQIYDFVNWIKEQDFYKDTVIVLTGDHLSMEPDFFNNVKDYTRTNYNVFLNTGIKKKSDFSNRFFNSFDIFPTIIASMGGVIPGDRLGLGTNLFSNKKTIYEEFGKDYVDKELNKRSEFYYKLLYGNN